MVRESRANTLKKLGSLYTEQVTKDVSVTWGAMSPQLVEPIQELDGNGNVKSKKIAETTIKSPKKVKAPETAFSAGTSATTNFKDNGPENADGVEEIVDTEKLTDEELKDNKLVPKKPGVKKDRKTKKVERESVNIFNVMNKKSTFDQLYENIFEDDELDIAVEPEGEFGPEDAEDEFGPEDEVGETVTVSVPKDVAEAIVSVFGAALEDEHEDEFNGDDDVFGPEDDGDEFPENTEGQGYREGYVEGDPKPATDGVPGLTGKGNKVGGTVKTVSGSADEGDIKEDGDPKPVKDGVPGLTGKGNKVKGGKGATRGKGAAAFA